MRFSIGLPITKINFLRDTLNSIKDQTYEDFEVIIRNNGATPEIRKEIRNICSAYMLNNYQYSENESQLNISLNFNEIFEDAKGDFFLILSDDDILCADYLTDFDRLISDYPKFDLFHCRVKLIDEENKLLMYTETCPKIESQVDFIYNRLTNKRSLYLSDFVMSSSALRRIDGFVVLPYGWGIDELTWFKLSKNNVAYTDQINLQYRVSNINYSNQVSSIEKKIKDIEPYKNLIINLWKMIPCNEKKLYPDDFFLKLINQRAINMRRSILESYTLNATFWKSIRFYLINNTILNVKSILFLKILIKKVYFKFK